MITRIKRAATTVIGIFAVLLFTAVPASSKPEKVEKVDVCHEGVLLSVAGPALAAHVRHGDTLPDDETGLCEVPLPDVGGSL